MSILSVHDIQGIATYSNTIRVPQNHTLNVAGGLTVDSKFKMPVWTDASRPTTGLDIGDMGWNTDNNAIEIYNGVNDDGDPVWLSATGEGGGGGFPAVYQSLIDSFTGTKYYVSPTGNNGNAGTSESAPWASPDWAFESAPSGSMIIISGGEYNYTTSGNMSGSSYNHSCVWDHNKNLQIVCQPGQTTFTVTNTTSRDFHACSLRNSNSNLYGAYIRRNNNARTNSYSVAFMGFNAGYNDVDGKIHNCVIREINANGYHAAHYDNSSLANWTANNCLFMGTYWTGNYSGGAGVTLNNCSASNASWTTSGSNNNTQTGATVQSNFSTGASNGVYSGTYAWDASSTTVTL